MEREGKKDVNVIHVQTKEDFFNSRQTVCVCVCVCVCVGGGTNDKILNQIQALHWNYSG